MKCYYEELGVERDASDVDIKSAYKKLALRWHPDKNPDCLEEAKQRFLLIQQAYEVLIDPQERAFYDNHREQILRGKNSDFEDNCLNVYEYFTITCFKGYDDDAKGFYAVYSEVFSKIAAEDAEFMEDEEEVENIPTFGNSKSSYEDVVGPFYAYWSSYCTKKTYTWLCPYDIKEAKDRRIIRAIDKEMKKVVQKAKKDRNEEVRSLVSFVRKRDKRVQEYSRKLEERTILNRKKQEQKRLEQLQKRRIELEEIQKNSKKTAIDESYEAQLKELEQQYGDESSEYDDDEEEHITTEDVEAEYSYLSDKEDELLGDRLAVDYDELFCVACNKKYKNKRAYVDHEMNKKHQDNVEQMRKEMLADEAARAAYDNANWDDLSELEEEQELVAEVPTSTKKKIKRPKYQPINELLEDLKTLDVQETVADAAKKGDGDEVWTDKKNNKKRKNKKPVDNNENKQKQTTNNKVEATTESEATSSSKKNNDDLSQTPDASQHACATCGTRFESKNKLFAHLKATKHSVYLGKAQTTRAADTQSTSNTKKSKGKKK